MIIVPISCSSPRVIDPERIAYSLKTFQHAAGRSYLHVVCLG
jgi:hypothetical protein